MITKEEYEKLKKKVDRKNYRDGQDLFHDALVSNLQNDIENKHIFSATRYNMLKRHESEKSANFHNGILLKETLALAEQKRPETSIFFKKMKKEVLKIVDTKFNSKEKELFHLRFEKELSISQICEKINHTQATVDYKIKDMSEKIISNLSLFLE